MTPLSSDGVVTVRWTLPHTGGLNITVLNIDYMTPDSTHYTSINTAADLRHQSSLQVEDLTAGEFYTFRITVTNELGNATDICPALWLSTGTINRCYAQ